MMVVFWGVFAFAVTILVIGGFVWWLERREAKQAKLSVEKPKPPTQDAFGWEIEYSTHYDIWSWRWWRCRGIGPTTAHNGCAPTYEKARKALLESWESRDSLGIPEAPPPRTRVSHKGDYRHAG